MGEEAEVCRIILCSTHHSPHLPACRSLHLLNLNEMLRLLPLSVCFRLGSAVVRLDSSGRWFWIRSGALLPLQRLLLTRTVNCQDGKVVTAPRARWWPLVSWPRSRPSPAADRRRTARAPSPSAALHALWIYSPVALDHAFTGSQLAQQVELVRPNAACYMGHDVANDTRLVPNQCHRWSVENPVVPIRRITLLAGQRSWQPTPAHDT
jgi:hypothetical protein